MIKHNTYLRSAFSVIEMLGAIAIIATVATVSTISVKDTLAAGQRSAIQKELQNLNNGLSNFKSAGGVIPDNATVSDALAALQTGATLGGASYSPLTSMPELTKTIGGVPYSLAYDPVTGFSYVPIGEVAGGVYNGAGTKVPAQSDYPFNIGDPAAAQAALASLASMDPESQEYQDYLAALNAANAAGTLSDAEMAAAGLIEHVGAWLPATQAYAALALDAQNLLDAGSAWTDLSAMQQEGYANTYPSLAVALGGADALNLMSPDILTAPLVNGYALYKDSWESPLVAPSSWGDTNPVTGLTALTGLTMDASTFSTKPADWDGWGVKHPIIKVSDDPLLPGELVGWVTPTQTQTIVDFGMTPTKYVNYKIEQAALGQISMSGVSSSPTASGGSLGGGLLIGGGTFGGTSPTPTPTPSLTTDWKSVTFTDSHLIILP